jgi:hypothetical protein
VHPFALRSTASFQLEKQSFVMPLLLGLLWQAACKIYVKQPRQGTLHRFLMQRLCYQPLFFLLRALLVPFTQEARKQQSRIHSYLQQL